MVCKKETAILHIARHIVFADEIRTVALVSYDDEKRFLFFADCADSFCKNYGEFNALANKYNIVSTHTQKSANKLIKNTVDSYNHSQKVFGYMSHKRPDLLEFKKVVVNHLADSDETDDLYLDALMMSSIFENKNNYNETFSESASVMHCLLVYVEKETETGEIRKVAIYDARSKTMLFNERFVTSQHDSWKVGNGKVLSEIVINKHFAERDKRISSIMSNRYAIVIERTGDDVVSMIKNGETGRVLSEYTKQLSAEELQIKMGDLVNKGIISAKNSASMLKIQMLTKKPSFVKEGRSLEQRVELLK